MRRHEPPALRRRLLLVAGMHRSGTSAAARVLGLLGGSLPREIMPPDECTNEPGFWEPQRIVQIHEEVLAAAGSYWHDTGPIPDEWFQGPAAHGFRDRLASTFLEEYGEADLAVVKDPRLCRLVPLWLQVAEALSAEPLFVIPFRNPIEVAGSLANRDGFSLHKSLLLWLQHVVLAEHGSRGHRRVFLSYDRLLADPGQAVARAADELQVAWPASLPDALADIAAFLSERHRHHRDGGDTWRAEEAILAPVREAYAILADLEAPPGGSDLARLDRIRRSYLEADSLLGPLVAATRRESERLRQELASRAEELATIGEQRAALEVQKQDLEGRLLARENDLHAERARSTAVQATLQTVSAALEASDRGVSELRKEVSALADVVNALATQTGAQGEILRVLAATASAPQAPEEPPTAIERRARTTTRQRWANTLALAGMVLRRTTRALFDLPWYQDTYPDVPRSRSGALLHFLRHGADEGRSPHPLFDARFYAAGNPGATAPGCSPFLHFLRRGGREGRDPHPLFDSSFYLEANPDVAGLGINPLAHFVRFGAAEGRDPHPLFDSSFYLEANPDVAAAGVNPLVHFLTRGAAEGRDPHPRFDSSFYLEANPDVAAAGVNPLVHFLTRGAAEGRDPHPFFGSSFYAEKCPDAVAAGMNPLVYFLVRGAVEGRPSRPAQLGI